MKIVNINIYGEYAENEKIESAHLIVLVANFIVAVVDAPVVRPRAHLDDRLGHVSERRVEVEGLVAERKRCL